MEEKSALNIANSEQNKITSSSTAKGADFLENGESIVTEIKTPHEFLNQLKDIRSQRVALMKASRLGKVDKKTIEDPTDSNDFGSNKPNKVKDEDLMAEFHLPSLYN